MVTSCASSAGPTSPDAADAPVVADTMEASVAPVEAGLDATAMDAMGSRDTTTGIPMDGYINIFEIFPIPNDGAIGMCANCVQDMCGMQVNGCVNNPACQQVVECVLQNCATAADGGYLQCAEQCAAMNPSGALQAYGAVMCVTSMCGSVHGPHGGGGDAGRRGVRRQRGLARVFEGCATLGASAYSRPSRTRSDCSAGDRTLRSNGRGGTGTCNRHRAAAIPKGASVRVRR